LLQIQNFFCGIGSINQRNNKKAILYSVNVIKDLSNIIIPHFENFPLLTKKAADLFF
jgi:LAGLIDADG endonuclease